MSKEPREPPSPPPPRPAGGPLPVAEIVSRLKLDRRPPSPPAAPRSRPARIITGRLEAHGRANYQFEANGSPSYYVRILSSRGPEILWGVDLERAIQQSQTQPKIGSTVGAQRVGSELVTLPAAAARPRTARRAQWIVESVTYFAESIDRSRREREAQLADQSALRERPELRSAFVSLPVAQKFADRNIADPRDRELFIERVKAVMSLSARQGAPSPAPRVKRHELMPGTDMPRREDPTR